MKALLRSRSYLLPEFLLLCVALPSWIIVTKSAPFMFAFLWAACGYCFLIYRACYFTSYRDLWKWRAINRPNLKPILLRWAVLSAAMLAFIYFYDAARLFYLPRHNPEILPGIIVMYPVISALPQEFIFCSFFFARYARYFGNGKGMVLASALAFAYAHILYINPVAPTLSFIGGLIFAQTYLRHKSLALVTFEHGLYGISLFVTGLGWYFYSGAVQ